MAQNSVDMTLGLVISLVWREGAERGAPTGSLRGKLSAKSQGLRAEENEKKISSEYVDDNRGT
jgi:hypothetical protein